MRFWRPIIGVVIFMMKKWFKELIGPGIKTPMPILSFPATTLLGVTVKKLIADSALQAEGMKKIAERNKSLASVSLMDLSLEAEAFGAEIITSDGEVPTVSGVLIKSMEEAESLKVPNVGAGRTAIYIEAARQAKSLIKDRPVFAGIIGPFSLSGRLIDMTEIMVNCYEEPEMVHLCLNKVTEFLIKYGLEYKKTGADGIVIAEPAAGLLSPGLFDEFSFNYVKRIVDEIQSDDFAVIYHNCGNTIPHVESIKSLGAYGYHFGNFIDLEKMLSIFPQDMVVMGNIDPVGQFRNGTPESIAAAVQEKLEACGKYPNYILSSGCDMPPLSPWANIDAFFRAAEKYQ